MMGRPHGRYRYIKRVMDLAAAVPTLILLSPMLAVIAWLVRWRLGGPVLFRQERAGINGRPFRILKFRTMTEGRDEWGNLLPDEQRLTPFGAFIRSTSLDELPQLVNVVLGHMSLVGPRPLHMGYTPRYSERQRRRLEVLPGMTGLAQVRGRNALTWDARLELDVAYVDGLCLTLDLQIILLTLLRLLDRKGISSPGQVTTTEFKGSDNTTRISDSKCSEMNQF